MVKQAKINHGRAEWRVVRSGSSATWGSSASSATSTVRAIAGIVNRLTSSRHHGPDRLVSSTRPPSLFATYIVALDRHMTLSSGTSASQRGVVGLRTARSAAGQRCDETSSIERLSPPSSPGHHTPRSASWLGAKPPRSQARTVGAGICGGRLVVVRGLLQPRVERRARILPRHLRCGRLLKPRLCSS